MNFIKLLLEKWSCKHKWKTYDTVEVYEKGGTRPWEIGATLICEHCGKIKKIKL